MLLSSSECAPTDTIPLNTIASERAG